LRHHPQRRRAADVGTGSGCIAVSLAAEIKDLRVLATDISLPALRVAQRNARKHGVEERVHLLQCDLLPPPPLHLSPTHSFDVICANLPYIPTALLSQLPVARYEPLLALNGGQDGLEVIRRFLRLLPAWVAPGGIVLLEIEASQSAQALSLAYDVFSAARIHLHPDLAGRDRLLEIQVRE
ncbi:MAG: N5-glutamine methyltransferase family protein, partial [Anaerolineales bacterium]